MGNIPVIYYEQQATVKTNILIVYVRQGLQSSIGIIDTTIFAT